MITPKTQAAIAVLNNIYAGGHSSCTAECALSEEDRGHLLSKLAAAGIIRCVDATSPQEPKSYAPARPSSEVSLLDILEATGEHLNCNHPTGEEFYMRYGKAAQKLGVINLVTRSYLQEIKLFEL